MDAYVAMGCRPTWTCAPYQLPDGPPSASTSPGPSRTRSCSRTPSWARGPNRYGDFIDICAAITGRVPNAGLHLTERRRGQLVFDSGPLPDGLLGQDVLTRCSATWSAPGAAGWSRWWTACPPAWTRTGSRRVGAAAASSGEVGLVHVVGSTPEAPTLAEALHHGQPLEVVEVTPAMVRAARDQLTSTGAPEARLVGVNVGTPHFSVAEFGRLVALLAGRPVHPEVEFYASTGRHVLARIEALGWLASLEAAGVRLVVDTCTYVTSILEDTAGVVMTSSAKWAWYAPGNLGVRVVLGSLRECVESAVEGRVVRDDALWAGP